MSNVPNAETMRRRRHPTTESAINALDHRSVDRVGSHGPERFERTGAVSVLAASLSCLPGIALGLVVAAIATAAAGQSPEPLPEWLEPDVGFDQPTSVVQAVETLTLPPQKSCPGRCQVDIAFVYSPEIIEQHDNDSHFRWPQSADQLENLLRNVTREVTAIWLRSGINAELRFVGMEADAAFNGLTARDAIRLEGYGRLRTKYRADLLYASPSGPGYHGTGWNGFDGGFPTEDYPYSRDRDTVDGALKDGSLWSSYVLGHQIGHNLYLAHDPQTRASRGEGPPTVVGGQGYIGTFPPAKAVVGDSSVQTYERIGYTCAGHPGPWNSCTRGEKRSLGTLMTYGSRIAGQPFSSPDLRFAGLPLGKPGVHDALSVARRLMPYLASVQPASSKDPSPYDCPGLSSSCLNNGRFKARALYGRPSGGLAYAPPGDNLLSDTGVVFWFFDRENPELLLKVVNGCWLNDHWWVFGSAATDLVYEVAVDDLAEGAGSVKYRHNGGGVIVGDNGYSTATGVINDTSAFPCVASTARAAMPSRSAGTGDRVVAADWSDVQASSASDTYYGCGYNCIGGGRFSLSAVYEHEGHYFSAARSDTFISDAGAVFSFFDRDNPELLIKVVNGCWLNDHYWVFGSAATDLKYNVTVTDYAAISRRNYASKGNGQITSGHGYETRAGVINDTFAFPCNP